MKRVIGVTLVICCIAAIGVGITYVYVQAQQTQAESLLTPVVADYRHLTANVTISGTTEASETVDLAFKNGGIVDSIPVTVGESVSTGTILMTLRSASIKDQLSQARSNVLAQAAKLRDLENGTRPEQIAVTKASLASDEIGLENAKRGLLAELASTQNAADVIVRVTIDQFITNPATSNSQFTILVSDNLLGQNILDDRRAIESDLSSWRARIDSLQSASTDDLLTASAAMHGHLQSVGTILDGLTRVLAMSNSTQSAANQAVIATARAKITGANDTLTASEQGVRSAQAAIMVAQRQLALEQAGATSDAVSAQQSIVESLQAQVAELQSELKDQSIVAPYSGIITNVIPKQNETVAAGGVVVSMISHGQLKVDGYVPEIHYSEIVVGEPAYLKLDAFPGISFPGALGSIDPTAELRDGVPNFKVTVTFTDPDPRLRPGLTANALIQTADRPNVLAIPLAAVTGTGDTATVLRTVGTASERTPVVLGIDGTDGYVEVLSGLSAGDTVLVNETKQYRIIPN